MEARSSCDARHSAKANDVVKGSWLGPDGSVIRDKSTTGDWTTMVTIMGIEKHAAFYRGFQPHDRSLFPVAVVLATLVAVWLLVYLVSAIGPYSQATTVRSAPHSAYAVSHPVSR